MPALPLFTGFGVELEYMIVDAGSLDVRPIADELLRRVAGAFVSEIELGEIAWSNEIALHVVELKTNGPAASLRPLPTLFHEHVRRVNDTLADLSARLMPTAMHPWMDPHQEMRLWPHEYSPVYEAFNRIFDCRGHGWANLQSVHINLPFADDAEFARLHAAIRLVLPILPALAASSPLLDRRFTGLMDNRLDVYRSNARRVPSVSGRVIPERAFSRADYDRLILRPLYEAIAPLDPEGVLQDEFLNARGAIARFSRNAIEIRLLDIQECPAADLAICAAVIGVLQLLCGERWSDLASQQAVDIDPLESILLATIRDADRAIIPDRAYLELFGAANGDSLTAGELWSHLLQELRASPAPPFGGVPLELLAPAESIVQDGPLARRMIRRVGERPTSEQLQSLAAELCDCLAENRMLECG